MSCGVKIPLIVICGPTASGKTALALDLARRAQGEIVSADSRQVYRGMDIGTAKASPDELATVPHHLIDVVDPDHEFTVSEFCSLGRDAIDQIHARGRLPFLAGGTGLYIRALTEGLVDAPGADEELRRHFDQMEQREGEGALYRQLQTVDPELADRLSPHDRVRVVRGLEVYSLSGRRLSDLQREHGFSERPYRLLKFGLNPDREELYRRIDDRVVAMVNAGLVEEVRSLLDHGVSAEFKAMKTIGYSEIVLYLRGEVSLDSAIELIQRNSRRYAKRQMTWFNKDKSIIWVDSYRESDRLYSLIEEFNAA